MSASALGNFHLNFGHRHFVRRDTLSACLHTVTLAYADTECYNILHEIVALMEWHSPSDAKRVLFVAQSFAFELRSSGLKYKTML